MSFLPIVKRELVLASRRSGTYWTRFWAAASVAAITVFVVWTGRGSSSVVGRELFVFLEVLGFLHCAFAGVRYTADALSAERREGTLGLLFLTNLRGHDVVLGKLAGRSLDSVFAVLAISPILAVPLLLGGTTGAEFTRLVWLLLNTHFWSLAVGLLVSSVGLRERNVTLGTLLVLLFWMLAPPLLWLLAQPFANSSWLTRFLLWPSPAYALWNNIGTVSPEFWPSMRSVGLLALGSIAGAAWLVPRSFREGLGTEGRGDPARALKREQTLGPVGFAERARRLEVDPAGWAAGRRAGRSPALWIGTLLIYGFVWWLHSGVGTNPPIEIIARLHQGVFACHLLFKFLVAVEACRPLHEDRRSGALELLLCTPLDLRKLVRGQVWRLIASLLPGTVALFLLNLSAIRISHEVPVVWIPVWGLGALVFDLATLVWLGLWRGLAGRGLARAAFSTFLTVMVPPWLPFALFFFTGSGGFAREHTGRFLFLWSCGWIAYDAALILWARHALSHRFRSRAAGA